MRRLIGFSFTIIVLLIVTSCSMKQEVVHINNLEEIENLGDYELLEIEQKQEIFEYIYSLDNDELINYLEHSLRGSLERNNEFDVQDIDIYYIPFEVSSGERPIKNIYIDMEIAYILNESLSNEEIEEKINNWFYIDISKVLDKNAVASLKVKNIKASFKNYELKREKVFEVKRTVTGNKLFGYSPKLLEGEEEAIKLANSFVGRVSETNMAMVQFGMIEENQLFIKLQVYVPSGDDKMRIPKLAETIANALKTEKQANKYIEAQKVEVIKIIVSTSNLGDLEYIFQV